MKKTKDYKLKYSVDKDRLQDHNHIREVFLLNFNDNEELRKDIWINLYCKKIKDKRERIKIIEQAEEEYKSFDKAKQEEWFDFVTDKDLSWIQEILFITTLIKDNKGNMRKVWKQLKTYGEQKKNDKRE